MQHMQQMQQRMQSMEERHQSMQEMMQARSQEGMQGMQQMQSGAAMQGMAGQQMREQSQSCLASGPQAGLSALLMGPVGVLSLSDQQRSTLEEILERAQSEALEALTAEQRAQLEAAPTGAGLQCQRVQQGTGATTGN
jgi:hypothetical protein